MAEAEDAPQAMQLADIGVSVKDDIITQEEAEQLLGVPVNGKMLNRILPKETLPEETLPEETLPKETPSVNVPHFLRVDRIMKTIQNNYAEKNEYFHEAGCMLTIVNMLYESINAEIPQEERAVMIKSMWLNYAQDQNDDVRSLADLRKHIQPRYGDPRYEDPQRQRPGENLIPRFHCTKEAARLMDILDYIHAFVKFVANLYIEEEPTQFSNSAFFNMFEVKKDTPSRKAGEGPVRWMYYYTMKLISIELNILRCDFESLLFDLNTGLTLNPFDTNLAIRPDILDGGVDASGMYALTKHEMYVEGTPIPASEIMVMGVDDSDGFVEYAKNAGKNLEYEESDLKLEQDLLDMGLVLKIQDLDLHNQWRSQLIADVNVSLQLQSEPEFDDGGSDSLESLIRERNDRPNREEAIEGYSSVIPTSAPRVYYTQEHNSQVLESPLLGTPIETLMSENRLHVVDRLNRQVPVLPEEKMVSLVDVKLDGKDGKLAMLVLISVHMVDLVRMGRPDMATDVDGNCVNWNAAVEADPRAQRWRRSVHIRKSVCKKLGFPCCALGTRSVDTQTLKFTGAGAAKRARAAAVSARAAVEKLQAQAPAKTEKTTADTQAIQTAIDKANQAEAESTVANKSVKQVFQHNFCSIASALEQLTRSRLIVCENKSVLFSAIDAYTQNLVPKDKRDMAPYNLGSWSKRLANPQGEHASSSSNAVPVVIDLRDMVCGYTASEGELFSATTFKPRGAVQNIKLDNPSILSHFHIEQDERNANTLGTDGRMVMTNERFSQYQKTSYKANESFGESEMFYTRWNKIRKDNNNILKCKYVACKDLTQFVRSLHIASWGAPLYLNHDGRVPRQNFLLNDAFDDLKAKAK